MIKTYYMLTKPGIILGNILTTAGGFALASKGHIEFGLFLWTLIGLSLIIASACVLNNYIDRESDGKMTRTQNRALVKGSISIPKAIIYATILGLLGILILALFDNLLSLCIALAGFFFYVVVYSLLKYRSVHATAIGSIAGAIPPIVGYCAVSNHLDMGAYILFAILVLWQMPHFFAIAIYRLDDYIAASIPVLPIKRGISVTKQQMLAYIIAFMLATVMLTVFGYTGYLYSIIMTLLGLVWLSLSLIGFKHQNHQIWARQMFRYSLIMITVLCVTIMFNDH